MTSDEPDIDLRALSAQWRDHEPPEPDLSIAAIQRRDRFSKVALGTELVVGAAGAAAGLYLLVTGEMLLGAAALAFGGGALAVTIQSSRGREGSSLVAPVSQRLRLLHEFYDRRARSGRAGVAVCVMALLFLALILMPGGERAPGPASWTVSIALVFVAVATVRAVRDLVSGSVMRERVEGLLREQQALPGDQGESG